MKGIDILVGNSYIIRNAPFYGLRPVNKNKTHVPDLLLGDYRAEFNSCLIGDP